MYNSFARVLGHYSRDVGLFDLATAIYRMSGFSAKKFGLAGRGEIAEGAWADLVLFDPDTVIDKGTFEDPNQYPAGLHTIFVNGQIAGQDDKVTGHRAGQVLTRAS